ATKVTKITIIYTGDIIEDPFREILQVCKRRIMSESNGIQPAAVQLCYENVNGSCIQTPYSPVLRVILYLTYGTGVVLAVLGNLLVMISILHFRQLHSPANFLIASLACADFLVGATVMPFSMVRSVESCWYFGNSYCKLHTTFDVAFCYTSLFHLCFISIDRYIAVTDPLTYPTKFTFSVSGLCITLSWTFTMSYSGSVFYTGVNDDGLEELVSALTCVGGCQIAVNQKWTLIHFLLFFTPSLIMIILYSKIFLVAKMQARKIESTGSTGESSSADSYKARVSKRERKAAKTLGIAVIAFMISWLPYSLDSVIDPFLGFITPAYVYEICCWFAYYNSAVNPLIYGFFYPWFRKAVKLIVTGKVLENGSSSMNLFSEQE
ncbi:trace amine-associated receptor 6-like, partial [Gracilinanus agilis]|uniref:trace amine-associated receptor 6-like n=1 Tax=Gracilinanus agilis TaxID=191870 RepID=UPI001CFDDFC1